MSEVQSSQSNQEYNFLLKKDLKRDTKFYLEKAYEKYPELINIIKKIDKLIKQRYSLYQQSLTYKFDSDELKYDYIISAHYRNKGFYSSIENTYGTYLNLHF